MKEKKFIRTLTYLCVAIMACGTAFAQQGEKIKSGPYKGPIAPMVAPDAPDAPDVPAAPEDAPDVVPFFTNFELNSCTGCTYSADNGFLLLGPANCGIPNATQWLAYPFVSKKTGFVNKVVLAITDWDACTPTVHKFTVAIYTDNCNTGPGTRIGSAKVGTAPASPCSLANANFTGAGVTLTAGNRYWVVVTTNGTASQMGTTAVWWEVNAAADYFNLNDGNGWQFAASGAPGAFRVQ